MAWESASVIAPCFCVLWQDYGNWKWDSGCRRGRASSVQEQAGDGSYFLTRALEISFLLHVKETF